MIRRTITVALALVALALAATACAPEGATQFKAVQADQSTKAAAGWVVEHRADGMVVVPMSTDPAVLVQATQKERDACEIGDVYPVCLP